MRIAFISTILGYPWGGADTLWTRAAEAAAGRGDELLLSVSPAVAEHPRITALVHRGARLSLRRPVTGPAPLPLRLLRRLGFDRSDDGRLLARLRKFRPELTVFSQGGTYDLLLHRPLVAWLRAGGHRFRVIANWQEEAPRLEPAEHAFIRTAFAAADRLAFVSTRNLATTRRHLDLPLPNACVVHNPLRWTPADCSPWPAGETVRLATVSRLDESKGIQLLLRALAEGGTSLPAWRLSLYGQGPHEGALRSLSGRLGLDGQVRFHGHVRDLRAIWADNQLMISPAIEDGVPMTIPEAMLCERPVLATCVGGAEDWLQDGRTGFLCPERTAPALLATLRTALARRDQWPAMGRAAAAAAQAYYRPADYLNLLN